MKGLLMLSCIYNTDGQKHLVDFLKHEFKKPITHTGRKISFEPVQDYHCRPATLILDNLHSSKIDYITKNVTLLSWVEGCIFQADLTEDAELDTEYFQKLFIQKEKHFNPEWNLTRNIKESLLFVGGAYTSMFAYLTNNTRPFIYLNNSTDTNEDTFNIYLVVNDTFTFIYWNNDISTEDSFCNYFKSSVIKKIEMDRDSLLVIKPLYIINKFRPWIDLNKIYDYPHIEKMTKYIKKLMV